MKPVTLPQPAFVVPAPAPRASSHEIELAKRAQEIPDSAFDDDPEVQHLRRDLEAKETRLQRVALGLRPEVQDTLRALRERSAEAGRDLLRIALDDVMAGDHQFHRAVIQARYVEHLQRVLAAAEASLKVMEKSLPERIAPFKEEAMQARGVLNSRLMALKRERAHQGATTEIIESKQRRL